jgi:hypothetical protein
VKQSEAHALAHALLRQYPQTVRHVWIIGSQHHAGHRGMGLQVECCDGARQIYRTLEDVRSAYPDLRLSARDLGDLGQMPTLARGPSCHES